MLKNISKIKEDREQGFTLVELMVAVLLIGILTSIAIPAIINQKKTAVDSSVQGDVKSAALVTKNWMVSHPNGTPTQAVIQSVEVSPGTTISITSTGPGQFVIKGINPKGKTAASPGYTYDSATGQTK